MTVFVLSISCLLYTSNELLRIARLKKAASLLASSDMTVSEIGYEVGFSSPSYFAKCLSLIHILGVASDTSMGQNGAIAVMTVGVLYLLFYTFRIRK